MNADDVETALGLIQGAWGPPAIEVEEATVLGTVLAEFTVDELRRSLHELTNRPRAFRPNPVEIQAMLRAVRQRDKDLAVSRRGLPEAPPAADPRFHIAAARARLAEARGNYEAEAPVRRAALQKALGHE